MTKTKTASADAAYICMASDAGTVDEKVHTSLASAEASARVTANQTGGRVFVCKIESVAETSVNVSAYQPPPKPRKPRADKGKPRAKAKPHMADSFAEAKRAACEAEKQVESQ